MDTKICLTSLALLGACACRSHLELQEVSSCNERKNHPVSTLSIPGTAEKYAALPPAERIFSLEQSLAGGMPAPMDILLVQLAKQFPEQKIILTCSSSGSIVDTWNRYAAEKIFSGKHFDAAGERAGFLTAEFGPAAVEMAEYFRLLERRITAAGALSGIGRPSVPQLCDIYDRDFLDSLEKILSVAAAKHDNELIRQEQFFFAQKKVEIIAQLTANIKKVYANSGKSSEFSSLYGDPADIKTTLQVDADDKQLMLTMTAAEPAAPELKISKPRPRDFADMWAEDGFEVFLIPDPAAPQNGWQFIINSRGSLWDARHTRVGACDMSWSAPNARVKFAELDKGWQVTLIIPWQDLGFPRMPAAPFLANIYRNRAIRGIGRTSYAWSPIYAGAYYQPAKFGKIIWQGGIK